jgi:hypothetical protein
LTLQSSPSFRRRYHQLENHEASGIWRQRAFHAVRCLTAPPVQRHAMKDLTLSQILEESFERAPNLDRPLSAIWNLQQDLVSY